jgi:hypothetical protein
MREAKFRQAAFVYLHVVFLYEAAAVAMMRRNLLPTHFGPPAVWLVGGAVVGLAVFVGLYRWQNVWLARVVWFLHGLRLPPLIGSAFFAPAGTTIAPSSFYVVAMVVVVINMWMLARAGWDL